MSTSEKVTVRPGRLFLFEMSVENDTKDKRSKKANTIRASLYYQIKQLAVKLPGSQGYWINEDDLDVALENFQAIATESTTFNEAQKLCGLPTRLHLSWIDIEGKYVPGVSNRLNILATRVFETLRTYLLNGEHAKAGLYLMEHSGLSRAFVELRARDLNRKFDQLDEIIKKQISPDKLDLSFMNDELEVVEEKSFLRAVS